jgi:competence protein ComEC
MHPRHRQLALLRERIEALLEAERAQLPLWVPVAAGAGIAAWFVLPDPRTWGAAALALAASALIAVVAGRGGRAGRTVAIGALAMLAGLLWIWVRAEWAAAPVLARPAIATVAGRVERIEPLPARELVRMTIASETPGLPPRVRLNLAVTDRPAGLGEGARVRLRARLMPPPGAAVPGAYDFARVAWFQGLGATGRGFAPVEVLAPGQAEGGLRARLSAHIARRLDGSAGGIAAALATGDEGAIDEPDAEAMRRAGLAHLLSVSGLHITAVVGATMMVMLRLLALSPWLALRVRLPLVASATGALAAIGYTWLTGAEVPTIRSCVAALLVLAALAMGREAFTLRLVAAGALVVMVAAPQSVAGASFQLSFAAIVAIVALHEQPRVQGWFRAREEGWGRWSLRQLGSLLLTGVAVEVALMPIAAFHFHQAGLYGALANIIAIPLTTFVVMPLEALALVLDTLGLGWPFWWLAGVALRWLLALAHLVAVSPGAVAAVPAMPTGAFALMVGGGLWLALWRSGWRLAGLVPLAAGAAWAGATPAPDLLVTGDGRHLAVRTGAGLAILRDRAGDYTRDVLSEGAGADGEPALLSDAPEARCSRDLCLVTVARGRRHWRVLATRSPYLVPVRELTAACRAADIVVSERRLPRGCAPAWLKLDRPALARSGGVAVTFGVERVVTVRRPGDRHPWAIAPTIAPPRARPRQ